jgi:hypothetical protein
MPILVQRYKETDYSYTLSGDYTIDGCIDEITLTERLDAGEDPTIKGMSLTYSEAVHVHALFGRLIETIENIKKEHRLDAILDQEMK